ncbi:MAG: hypothetical protein AAGH99_03210 [Planctomycetota bacterium]
MVEDRPGHKDTGVKWGRAARFQANLIVEGLSIETYPNEDAMQTDCSNFARFIQGKFLGLKAMNNSTSG